MRERTVEQHLVQGLKEIGVPCLKFNPDHMVGMPDRLILLPGHSVIWCELKTRGGSLSEVQQVRHRGLRSIGQRVEVVWDTEQADKLIEEIKSTYL